MRIGSLMVIVWGSAVALSTFGQAPPLPPYYESRLAELEQARKANPRDLLVLQTLADSYAMGARYEQAIEVVRDMLVSRTDDQALILRLARLYTWSGRAEPALDELAKLHRPVGAEATELECQVLTASRRASKAASCYERLIELVAGNPDKHGPALLALARNRAWSGHSELAIHSYELYLQMQPRDRTATIELIRVLRYQGNYSAAERLCNTLLAIDPRDAEVLALKAEVLHWAGHRWRTARGAAERAVELAPDLADALVAQVYSLADSGALRAARQVLLSLREQVAKHGGVTPDDTHGDAYRLLENDLGSPAHVQMDLPFSVYNDVDGIHDIFSGLRFSFPVRSDHQIQWNLNQYVSSAAWPGLLTAGRNRAAVREFTAGGTLWAGPAVTLAFAGGGSARSGDGSLRPIFDFHTTATPMDRWQFDLSVRREFLKITPRAIDLDMSTYKVSGSARYTIDPRTSLSLQAERNWWSDANRSMAGGIVLDRVLHYYKPFLLHGGLLTRYEHFDRNTRLLSGFFTPDQYRRHEGYLGAHGEVGRIVTWEVQATGGAQRMLVAADYRPSWDVTASVGLRLTRFLRLFGSYQRRNYSLLTKDGWYQGFYFTLGMLP